MSERKELSFDGFGINGPDEFKTRLATFNLKSYSDLQIKHYGKLFAASPDMIMLLMKCHAVIDPYEDGILREDIARLLEEIRT